MRKQAILISLLLAFVNRTVAQTAGPTGDDQTVFPQFTPNIVPPSPDAYSFTRYGSLPIGLSTGTAQYSLPVYTIQSGSLNHSIGVSYSSNGVKVDEMATRVGINWNLKAGGMITRTIMDKPDEGVVSRAFFHGYAAGGSGNWTFYNYIKQAAFGVQPDFQPDEYSFNVDGYTGKFLKRENGEFTQFTSSALKIEKNGSGFILTAPTGTKYYFYLSETAKNYSYPETTAFEWMPGAVPTAWYLTKILSPDRDSIVFNYTALISNPDSVIRYKNGITQDFSVGSFDNFYINTSDYSMGYRGSFAPGMPYLDAALANPPGITTMVQVTDNRPWYLSSVTFKGGQMNFIYSGRDDVTNEKKLDTIKVVRSGDSKLIKCVALQYTYSNAAAGAFDTYVLPGENYTNQHTELRKRLFLTGFDELATGLQSKQSHAFEYEDINGLPPRLSFAQDRYGSFNGKVNTYFFPNDTWFDKHIGYNQFGGNRAYNFNQAKKGILKKIMYPTGGYTEFQYEPNKTEGDYAFIYNRDSVYAFFDTSLYAGQQIISDTFQHDGQHDISFRAFCEWASVPVDPYYMGVDTSFGAYYITYYIIDNSTNTCISPCGWTMEPGDHNANGNFGLTLPQGTYKIKAIANRAHFRAKVVVTRTQKVADHSDASGVAGIRVKTIADYPESGTATNRRTFIYGNWDDTTSSSGTGLNFNVNNGNEVSMTRLIGATYNNQGGGANCGYNTIHSNSVMTNFLTENNTVLYKKVIELNDNGNGQNNGGTEYEFYYDTKKYPIPVTFTWGADVWDPAPIVPNGAAYMNNDYRTGMIKGTKTFTCQQKYGSRNIVQETSNYYSLDTAHLVIDTFTISKEIIKRTTRNPSWPYFWDFDIYRCWRYFGFLKQDSVIQKEYTATGQLVNKVVYGGYNTQNYRPNNIQFYSSADDTRKVTRKYVCDVLSFETNYALYAAMKVANIIDPLLEEKSYMADISTDVEMVKKRMAFSQFNGIYLPAEAYSAQKGNTEYLEISYQQYDSSGNLLQYTGKDGVITSIVWGYNKQYPVAKVVGKTYSDVLSQSSINMSVVNNPSSDAALKTELDKLRTISNSFATTYIYDPLIGVKTETDPNGRTIYYQYDNFNRLSLVRDKDNNIIKKICYNFHGQPVDCGQGTVAAWTAISSTCDTSGGAYTGYMTVTEKDLNPASGSYNQTRTVSIANGGCLTVTVCAGEGKKIIDGVCAQGLQIYTSSVRTGSVYVNTYYYIWFADCSVSGEYSNVTSGRQFILEPDCP